VLQKNQLAIVLFYSANAARDLMSEQVCARPGRYRHYKGNHYEVLGVARHSETEEKMVVYRKLYGDQSRWVRPLVMFMEAVQIEGSEVPRFEWVDDL
jgi:hypothetical protein